MIALERDTQQHLYRTLIEPCTSPIYALHYTHIKPLIEINVTGAHLEPTRFFTQSLPSTDYSLNVFITEPFM